MKVKVITPQPVTQLTTKDLEEGQVGILAKDELFAGDHILRAYEDLILLEDPSTTWWPDPKLKLDSILTEGTVIQLTL